MPELDNGRDIVIDTIRICLQLLRKDGDEPDDMAVTAMTAMGLLGRIASIGRDGGEAKADLRLAHEVAVAYLEIVKASEVAEIIRKLLQPVN